MFKVTYNADSTKSFMMAMEKMTTTLQSVNSEHEKIEVPQIDKEDGNYLKNQLKIFQSEFQRMKNLKINSLDSEFDDDSSFEDKYSENEEIFEKVTAKINTIEEQKFIDGGAELMSTILDLLESNLSEEEIQPVLFDLLGFEDFDLISELVQKRRQILDGMRTKMDEGNKPMRSYFLSDKEKADMYKENLELAKNADILPKEYSASPKKYPHVYSSNSGSNGNMLAFGKKLVLPPGSTRENYGNYEEVIIPSKRSERNDTNMSELKRIKDLDYLCMGTFTGYKTLNRVQSLVFPVAYESNENMLICAPTGAGKTDIAMLTILHTIEQFTTQDFSDSGDLQIDIDYNEFKIVYIAPLKALAAEIVEKFTKKLKWLNIQVRELTGDMQLTKTEILNTQIIVTTPEKWDVVTRKASGDDDLISKVKLFIIDEVHLLHEERGSVIETLVARTLRQVESTQSMIRIIGLSATLPNYVDVSDFLGVNREVGMFYFDQSFRPIPLRQEVVAVRQKAGTKESRTALDEFSYRKLVDSLKDCNQVMVFVHSRKDTVNTARTFISFSRTESETSLFDCRASEKYEYYSKEVSLKSRNKDIKELFAGGFGIHNAGMLRSDRNLVEKMFASGAIKVLVCTATLAWGVNLPASTVIIKGTQVYNSKQGGLVDLGISDIIQIFGRAGRPQYERFGTGILCTTTDRMDHYLSLLTQQHPIESKFAAKLVDNLNAEISLGTVMNVDDGVRWLGYTYLFVRMRQNPFSYGLDWKDLQSDPQLVGKRREMIVLAARRLHSLQMIVFDEKSLSFISKDLGRIASDFYLLSETIEIFNKSLNHKATEADVIALISFSSEFDNITSRQEEETELKKLLNEESKCQVAGDIGSSQTKTNILFQSYISRSSVKSSALISDMNYVAQNSARICRALFLIGINRRWGSFSRLMLNICQSIDKQMWYFDHPLAQFDLNEHLIRIIRSKNPSLDTLKDMEVSELGDFVHNMSQGKKLSKIIDKLPTLYLSSEIFPITANVVRVKVTVESDFVWDKQYHGNIQMFWLFVESDRSSSLLHFDRLILNQKNYRFEQVLDFMIPLSDPLPSQIIVSAMSDTWIGSETSHSVSFRHLIRPSNQTTTSKLLKLQPLPITALHNPEVEAIYSKKFSFFNAMQTMVFHSLYNTDSSAFIGSPTGSGKTVAAEIAVWHALSKFENSKVVYIAPMKALVRERVDDWREKICKNTSHTLVELTGDSTPEASDVKNASIIVTTPEKFDGISRNWQSRKFVQQVSLVIMDEIHLLASDRGPILEMIVSRMNFISSITKKPIRLLGMSTAVSNSLDMASWLGVKNALFNFPSAVRPVPLQMYIDGFPDNLPFCPLMKKMNKPAFVAIKRHSPQKPVLIFVASRRQTRLTALDLIHLCGMEDNPRRFLRMDENELESTIRNVKDETLRLSLSFGIGLHHAGLIDSDRKISHKLFEKNKIQILVATSTLAWGVNLPAHLVIIKGTQFFDAKIEGYRDMDLTDVLQMMGRAGRPAFDTSGIAIVYTKESKKNFYKHFINVGFPVESSLHKVLDDHIGAEISSGTIKRQQDALDFLSWTFLFRRIYSNPTYYGIEDTSETGINIYLTNLVDNAIRNLNESRCIKIQDNGNNNAILLPTPFLKISSYYYISHNTIRTALNNMTRNTSFKDCLRILSLAFEYNELPTRHGEELINSELSNSMRYPVSESFSSEFEIWDPHVKAFLLIQAYMSRTILPIADYVQDTVTVMDQALRLLQALIDVAAALGYLKTVLNLISLMYGVKQGHWFDDDSVYNLPGFEIKKLSPSLASDVDESKIDDTVPEILDFSNSGLTLNSIGSMSLQQLKNLKELKTNIDPDSFIKVAMTLPTGSIALNCKAPNKLEISLIHHNMPINRSFKVYCSKYSKMQKEGWFFMICSLAKNELYVLRRATPRFINKNDKKGMVIATLDIPESISGLGELDIICINDALPIKYIEKHKF